MKSQNYGLKRSDVSSSVDQVLWFWSSQVGLSIEDYEQLLPDLEWQDIKQRLKLSARRSSVRLTRDKEFLSLPTPTTLPSGNGKTSAAGQNNLETTLRSQNRLSLTQKLNPALCAWMLGFPPTWTESALMDGGNSINHHSQPELNHEQPDVENV